MRHCTTAINMEEVLKEAARLVKPGGLLVSDHDPQHSAWNFKGIAWFALWQARLLIYRVIKKGFHRSGDEQSCVLTSEIHHDAVRAQQEMFHQILEPLWF